MCTCTQRSALEPLCTARGQRPGRILSINGWQASRKWIRRRGSKAWPACEKERVDRGDVGEEKDQGRGCCERAGLEAEIETRSTHQGSDDATAAAKCSRAAKQVQLLEAEENICLVDSQGKDEKKIHGRTLAGHRAGLVAHSRRPTGISSGVGCSMRSGGEELPSGIAIIGKAPEMLWRKCVEISGS